MSVILLAPHIDAVFSGETDSTYKFDAVTDELYVDGLGRLIKASEQIENTSSTLTTHDLDFSYDMRSQLTDADITNISSSTWSGDYSYKKDGNIQQRILDGTTSNYTYNGDLMTNDGSTSLTRDKNGRLKTGLNSIDFAYNWEGKPRQATIGSDTLKIKYDPMGNRVWRESYDASGPTTTTRKYIVDIVGKLPTILGELAGISLTKSYIYTDSGQILCQRDGGAAADEFFYVTDRLGSVRQFVNKSKNVLLHYTYSPFGQTLESSGSVYNPFMYTGQWYDSEIGQYHLRARMYDPVLMRFTDRDPVRGKFKQPLTLHKYLYCTNDPVNRTDPDGRIALNLVNSVLTGAALYAHGLNLATYATSSGNEKFWSLAEATFEFMPVGAAIASTGIGARTLYGALAGTGAGAIIETVTDMTGMGYVEGLGMNYFAYLTYGVYILNKRAELGIWYEDMQDFRNWRENW